MGKVKISNLQLGLLTFGFLYGNTVISSPVAGSKRDAWLALIVGWAVGLVLITMFLHISKLNPQKDLVGILQHCFGKIFGKIFCVLYIVHFVHIAALNLRGFGDFMSTVTYSGIPLYILMGVLMLCIIYIVRSGLETMGRLSEIFVPIIPIPVIIVGLSIFALPNFTPFEPFLVEIAPVIKAAATSVSIVFGDLIVFLMILPYTNDEKGRSKSIYTALAGIGIMFMLIIVRNINLIGPELMQYLSYPSHVASQMIPSISIDALVDLNLLLGGGFKIVVYVFAATKATAELFNIENYKPLVCAFGVLVFVFAYWVFPNGFEGGKWLKSVSVIIYCFPFQTLLPLLMFFISLIKNKHQSLQVQKETL